MSEKHRELIGIPSDHGLNRTGSETEQRRGWDTDVYFYDELNPLGEVVAKYEVRDSMSIYPPQKRELTFTKLS